jgi:hypothetical protein
VVAGSLLPGGEWLSSVAAARAEESNSGGAVAVSATDDPAAPLLAPGPGEPVGPTQPSMPNPTHNAARTRTANRGGAGRVNMKTLRARFVPLSWNGSLRLAHR